VDIHSVVNEVTNILAHSIDKKIVIETNLTSELSTVLGDSSQLQNAILNLALNARDAMPNGGHLSFSTRRCVLDGSFVGNPPFEVAEGEYVCLTVSDTGIGISAEIQHRVFEPFFTTKPSAQGTGLGLSAVYGTVKNHRGALNLSSTQGEGSRIELYLPASDSKVAAAAQSTEPASAPGQSRRVVVVEDEAALRDVAFRMLTALGYQVETFASGPQALQYYEKHAANVDLVILDMVMPVMSGTETFAAMKRIQPDVKAILASGYSLDGDTQAVMDDGVRGFLQKPYRCETLADLLRRVLDEPNDAG
jgi:CheY-like chemotaxis protein